MSGNIFRIHPAIGIARVGDSDDYCIAPETAAGSVDGNGLFGGLPVRKGTENTPISSDDLRDANQGMKRQAARFRIYAYPDSTSESWPRGDGEEVRIGMNIGGKTVKDILWTVHVANKKSNNFSITSIGPDGKPTEEGIVAYEGGKTPPVRNPEYGDDLATQERLTKLVIDPGPRALQASAGSAASAAFDISETPSCVSGSSIESLPNYPVSFPSMHFSDLYQPIGGISTLGEMLIEDGGRLLVTGGKGVAEGWKVDGKNPPLDDAIDNNYWFDDASDGPVNATIVFDDNSTAEVTGAWVVTGDPGFAPQVRNVVSAWDDVYDAWVQKLGLVPDLYSNGSFNPAYEAAFDADILPVFHAAFLQRWTTNLPSGAINGHNFIGGLKPSDNPSAKIPNFERLFRNPDSQADIETGPPLMPLSLGDALKSFLTVSPTQYFLLKQWYAGKCAAGTGQAMGPGEAMDRISLENCLGGRYSPGIEVTFIVRDENLYIQDWQKTGPFRVNEAPMDYSTASKDKPFLGVGYIPLRQAAVEPGDISKFMALPWHTDYNSCAVHLPDPNPTAKPSADPDPVPNNTLYWSWPAERPVVVHPAAECSYNSDTKAWMLGGQRYAVRGPGTESPYPAQAGRYQTYPDFLMNWARVGFIIQGQQIASGDKPPYDASMFLEIESLETDEGNMVQPWPTANVPAVPSTEG